jgi:hypothetical protein
MIGTTRRLLSVVTTAALLGCAASPPPLPPPPQGVREIAVQAPVNRTGGELVVNDPGAIGRYLGDTRSTVPDLLAADLRTLLAAQGFRVVSATTDYVPALRTDIRRWKPYSADYSEVEVGLVATLVDPETGRTLWTAERTDWRVQTPDARSAPEASATATREIARALIEGWQPQASSPPAARTP